MASAQSMASPQLQALIAGSVTATSGRCGTRRAGPSSDTTCTANALSKGWRAGSTSSQLRKPGARSGITAQACHVRPPPNQVDLPGTPVIASVLTSLQPLTVELMIDLTDNYGSCAPRPRGRTAAGRGILAQQYRSLFVPGTGSPHRWPPESKASTEACSACGVPS